MHRSYYVPGKLTAGLEPIARYAVRFADQKSLVQDVVRWLGIGDDEAFGALLADMREYARCFRDVGKERRFNTSTVARIHVMAACDLLVESLPRAEVTKALVRKTACDLWTRACRSHLGAVPTEMLQDLRDVRWRRIYSDLGLSDLREAHRTMTRPRPRS